MTDTVSSLTAFIFSDNSSVVESAKKILESHRFSVTTLEQAATPAQLCRRSRYDLAIYDEDYASANKITANEFSSTSHVVLKLVSENKLQQLTGPRFHFLMQKPFTGDLFDKTIRAAYGLVALGRRSTFRQQVSITASSSRMIHQGNSSSLNRVKIVNVSHSGMCVETPAMLPQGAQIELSFPARDLGATLEVTGTVIWSHISGRAGIKLAKGNSPQVQAFESWLASILPGIDEFLPALPNQSWQLRRLKTSSLQSLQRFPIQRTFSKLANCTEIRSRRDFKPASSTA